MTGKLFGIDKKLLGVGFLSIGYFELIVWGLQSGMEPILSLWAAGVVGYVIGIYLIHKSDEQQSQ